VQKVIHSAGQGIPIAAQMHPDKYKLIFLDVALSQALLSVELKDWLLAPHKQYINKGPIIEAFIGQEMLAYSNPKRPAQLFYWQNDTRSAAAEVDYLSACDQKVIPVEVKSEKGTSLKSMRIFLELHQASPYGVRFSTHNYSIYENIHSYPLYAVSSFCTASKTALLQMILASRQSG